MISVVRFDRSRKRVCGEVCADAGFDVAEQIEIARVADRVGADAERAAVRLVQAFFDIRLAMEQFVLVDQFDAAGEEILSMDLQNGLGHV